MSIHEPKVDSREKVKLISCSSDLQSERVGFYHSGSYNSDTSMPKYGIIE